MRLAIRKTKKLALGIELSKYEENEAPEDATAEEVRKFTAEEAAGKGDNSTSEVT